MDGSALSCESLIEREVVMKVRLIRESFYYLALIKSVTNTIRGTEENYRDAKETHIDLQVKQKKGAVRKSVRKAAREGFDEGINTGSGNLVNALLGISKPKIVLSTETIDA